MALSRPPLGLWLRTLDDRAKGRPQICPFPVCEDGLERAETQGLGNYAPDRFQAVYGLLRMVGRATPGLLLTGQKKSVAAD